MTTIPSKAFPTGIAAATLALGIAFAAAGPASAASPTFSCSGNLNSTERAICKSSELSRLDRQMSAEYFGQLDLQTSSSARRELRNAQRSWLRDRNSCGGSVACIRGEYQQWIEQLAEWGL